MARVVAEPVAEGAMPVLAEVSVYSAAVGTVPALAEAELADAVEVTTMAGVAVWVRSRRTCAWCRRLRRAWLESCSQ